MAFLTVKIAGVDRSQYLCGPSSGDAAQFEEALRERKRFSLEFLDRAGLWYPLRGQGIIVEHSTEGRLFGGVLATATRRKGRGNVAIYTRVTCVSYEQIAQRRLSIARSWTNQIAGGIFNEVVSESLIDEGFTVEFEAGPVIPYFEVLEPRPSTAEVLDRICQLASTGSDIYYWDVTPDRVARFFKQDTYPAPFAITDENPLILENLSATVDETNEGLVNAVYVFLGQFLLDEVTETMPGNGTRRFELDFPIGEAPTITVDAGLGPVDQEVGIDGVDTGKKWYYRIGSNIVRQDEAEPELAEPGLSPVTPGHILAVTYKGLDKRYFGPYRDDDSANAEGVLQGDGTTGIYEKFLELERIGTAADAATLAQSWLDRYKKATITFRGATFTPGLRAGQELSVTLATLGIDLVMLVQSVTMTDMGNGSFLWAFTAIQGAARDDWKRALLGQNASSTISGTGVGVIGEPGGPDFTNVKRFGALGDPAGDDTAAILSAIVACAASAGNNIGRLYFPAGVYPIAPASPDSNILDLLDNIHVHGAGMGIAEIKIKDGAGSFKAIFGPPGDSPFRVYHNIQFSDITVNYNSENNEPADAADIAARPRLLIGSAAGSTNMHFERLHVDNVKSINVIFSMAPGTTVRGCEFTNIGSGSAVHDHSTLYMACEGAVIADNLFLGRDIDAPGAVCAIETHGGGHAIGNNVVDKMLIGMNITGVTDLDSVGVAIANNVMKRCFYGIQLWSYVYLSHTTGYGLRNVNIANNVIHLASLSWTVFGINSGNPFGIALNPGNSLPIRNLSIKGNIIEFDKSVSSSEVFNDAGGGITTWDGGSGVTMFEEMEIADNTVVNCPMHGIRVSAMGSGLRVDNNYVINAGSSQNRVAAGAAGFYSGIFLTAPNPISRWRVRNNLIRDDQAVTMMRAGITQSIANLSAPADVEYDGNIIEVTGDAVDLAQPHLLFSSDDQPLIRDRLRCPNATILVPGAAVQPGSELLDLATGKRYFANATGSAWRSYTAADAPPSAGVYGDIVLNNAPSGGAPVVLWLCIIPGDPATWQPLHAIDVSQSLALGGSLQLGAGGNHYQENDTGIYFKDTLGTYIQVLAVLAFNQMVLRNPGVGTFFVKSAAGGGTTAMVVDDTGTQLPLLSILRPLKTNATGYVTADQIDLGAAADVKGTGLTTGANLKWDGSKVVNATGITGQVDLSDAAQVDGAGLTPGSVVLWDGSKLASAPAAGAVDLGDAAAVDGTGLTSGHPVIWDGSKLINTSTYNGSFSIAKLTPGGSNGSISVVNGLIVGVTAPT